MKKIFALIALAVLLSVTAKAQTFNVTPSIPVFPMAFRADTLLATDTNWVQFYAPVNMYVQAVQVVASKADSGTSGSGAGVFKLYKYGTSTAIVQDSVTAANSVKSASPSSSSTAKLTKGSVYKISWTQSGAEKLYGIILIIWYRL